ncbi:MAG: hypothetical protein IJ654_05440 [Bacteroidales bacterium]|nr:hypothetical protein [Bacteroidales bacterium]
MDETLYMLDCSNASTSWRAWQNAAHNEARRFDRQLFTRSQINAMGHHLDNVARTVRNYVPGSIRLPDWDFCDSYNVDPSISLGPGCTIAFRRTAGNFRVK